MATIASNHSLAKLQRPKSSFALRRERLFRALDELKDRPCTWITAPPGYGKTTLAANYLEEQTCLWYQMDEDDNDIASFFHYLSFAAQQHCQKPLLPLLTAEPISHVATFARRYFRLLFQCLPLPLTLVFDDYQRIAADSLLHEAFREAIAQAPEQVRIIVLSRSLPPPPLVRACSTGALVLVDSAMLRLTLDEARAIADLRARDPLPDELLQQLHKRVQGWAAGLALLLQFPAIQRTLPASEITLFDYFAYEIINQTDAQTRLFLLQTAFLPHMTAAMAAEMSAWPQAAELLRSSRGAGYFLMQHGATEPVYEYHSLFRDFLLTYGNKVFSPAAREAYRRRAAALLEQAGDLSAAAELWRELGDWPTLARVVRREAEALLQQGRGQTLERWLQGVPGAILVQLPWLAFWLGQCRVLRAPDEARTLLQTAYDGFQTSQDAAGLWLSWCAIVNSYWQEQSDLRPLAHWLAEFERLQARPVDYPDGIVRARVAYGVFTILVALYPNHPQFGFWENRLFNVTHSRLPAELRLTAANLLLQYYLWYSGQRSQAANVLEAVQTLLDSAETPPAYQCARHCWQASSVYWFEGTLEDIDALLKQGMSLAKRHSLQRVDANLLMVAVTAQLTAGRLSEAQAYLQRLGYVLPPGRPQDSRYRWVLEAWSAWLGNRTAAALEAAHQAERIDQQFGGAPLQPAVPLVFAQIHAAQNDYAQALRRLAAARRQFRQARHRAGLFICTLVTAQLALERGQNKRCLRLLHHALILGREQGYINTPLIRPETMATLCAKALEAGIEVDYVKELIRRRQLTPNLSAPPPEHWPWPVKIYTFGRFALLVDGKLVQPNSKKQQKSNRKVQQKPLALLKSLLAHGGRDVAQQQLADALWPDADGDAAQQSFKTTLYRLRQLLRHDQALRVENGCVSLDARYCWADVWHSERWLGIIERKLREEDPETLSPQEMARLTRQLLRIWRGSFLSQEDGDDTQIATMRRRLQNKYLHCFIRVGHYWEKRENWEKACDCYRCGLEVDPLAKVCEQGLTRCYAQLGWSSEVT